MALSGTAAAGAAGLAVVGCGGGDNDNGNGDGNRLTPVSGGRQDGEDPVRGGTLRSVGGPIGSLLDIHRTNTPWESAGIWHWAGNFLMRFETQDPFQPEPDLAADHPEITDDGTRLIFRLRPEARWQQRAPANGRQVVAEDVKATFERIKALGPLSPRSGNYTNVESINAIDETTVEFRLRAPQADLLAAMSDQYDLIIPREIAARGQEAIRNAQDVVGSGPYELVNFEPGQGFQMRRRADDYWKPNTAWLDGWQVTNQVDPQQRVNALRANQADVTDLPADLARTFEGDNNFYITSAPNPTRECLLINHNLPRYQDPRVRLALSRAIDRQQVYDTVFAGGGMVGGPMTPAAPAWVLPEDELLRMPGYGNRQDEVREARALLSAAGFPNGFEETVLTVTAFNVNGVNDVIVSNLRDVGIRLTTENVGTDFAVFLGREIRREYALASTLFLSGPYPDAQLYIYHHTKNGSRNYGDYGNPELDQKLDRQRTIYDFEERLPLVQEIQRYIIENPGPAWIGSRVGFGVYSSRVRNAVAHPFLAGYDDAEDVFLRQS
jgi:peptide/nickel transport system substrate-binding protein